MLVDKAFLYAVVSLPAGVFQPYSGVKTSILLMDKTIAGKTDKILFVKIQNDGFGLGAQRREQATSDLPDALNLIRDFQQAVLQGDTSRFAGEDLPLQAVAVEKTQIAANGDYNLSGDRFKVGVVRQHKFEAVELSEVANIRKGASITKKDTVEGDIPVIAGGQSPAYFHNEANRTGKVITVSASGAYSGFINYFDRPIFASDCSTIESKDENRVKTEFLYYVLKSKQDIFYSFQIGGAQPHVYPSHYSNLQIPLPPLSIQKEIVEKIEGFQRIIDGAKQVVENYKPQIDISPDWEMVELGEVCEVNPKKSELNNTSQQTLVSFVPMADLNENQMDFTVQQTKQLSEVFGGYTYFKDNDVLLAKVTPCFENGKAGIAKNLENGIGFGSSEYYVFRCAEKILPVWVYLLITDNKFRETGKARMTGTGGLQRVPKDYVQSYQIPLPPIEVQQEIVARIEREQSLVNSNKELITIFEQKVKDEINKLWQE